MQLLAFMVLGLVITASASAQPVQQSPTQTAIQIDNVINGWATALESQQKQIVDLQKQLADMQKLCGKPCEPKK